MKFIKVKSLSHLKKLVANKTGDFRMQLNGGVFSRKYISYYPDKKRFWITNCIDDSEQDLTEKDIMNEKETLIGKAIKYGALWLEEVME